MHRWFGFQYLLALHAFCCESSWPTLWVTTNEHLQINTKSPFACQGSHTHPCLARMWSCSETWLCTNGTFSLCAYSDSCHRAVTKRRCHCLLLLKDLQKQHSWGLGVQCGLLGTRCMLLCHTSQGTEVTEVVWSDLKTCVAQGIKALLCCCSVPVASENLILGVKLDLQNIPFAVNMSV